MIQLTRTQALRISDMIKNMEVVLSDLVEKECKENLYREVKTLEIDEQTFKKCMQFKESLMDNVRMISLKKSSTWNN